ncbi:hypothetical protein [Psychromonas algicola]|uniref:hypothetical protein n=1 Tax=Psychromonas algicola TaxID=2555642 RepID=UPI001067A458|nr:hypothetical protein [Psychromonas sp. RZ5]TEW51489.1 hypothetical protein E2R67_06890 [Psychromonas sp. RZ5]
MSDVKLGKYPQIYKTSDYKVTMLRIGDADDKTFLIKVDGVDNDFDGQIYFHETKCHDTRCSSYVMETKEIPGKAKWWTIQSTSSWSDFDNLTLFAPGIDQRANLTKSDRPDDFDANAFYQEYLAQKTMR